MKKTGQCFTVLVVCERCGEKGALEVHQNMSVAKMLHELAGDAVRKKPVVPPAWGHKELPGPGQDGIYCRGCIDKWESLIALQKDQISAFAEGYDVQVEIPDGFDGGDDGRA